MFNPTRSQLLFVAAIVIGLVIGKLIKNFKVAFAITIILFVAFSINFKKRKAPVITIAMPVNKQINKEPTARYWGVWYIIVLAVLVAEVLVFLWLTDHFK
jgi:hypothetical protein